MRISDWSSDVCSSDLLKIVILTPDPERFRGAITLAAAQAALGASVSIFLQLEAVALLSRPYGAPGDSAHKSQGLPTLAALPEDPTALGVTFPLSKSGMDLTGLTVVECDLAAIFGGPVSFLQSSERNSAG